MNPLKWIVNLFPPEKNDTAGWGPFRLPEDALWIERAAFLHDWEFENASADGKRLSQVDAEFFDRLVLLAKNIAGDNYMLRCKMYGQIADYWTIARDVGKYFWDSPELERKILLIESEKAFK